MVKRVCGSAVAALAGAVYLGAAHPSTAPSEPPSAHGAAVPLMAAHQQAPAAPAVSPQQELLNRYCVNCHNNAKQTAGLSLEALDVNNIGRDSAVWETIVAKLRAGAMPPVGMRRPDRPTYLALIEHLENELDRAANVKPDPGRTVVHRLTRAEYGNAIRDLLHLEVDASSLLPPDNVGYGFDSIGEVLSVSPLLMEQYMFAAERITRLAIGDATVKPGSERYVLPTRLLQQDRMNEDLPFGSQGGTAIRHVFPADGEYTIAITLQKNADGYIRGLREQHQLDVRVDGERVKLFTLGGDFKGRSGPLFTDNQNPEYSGDAAQTEYEFTADEMLVARFKAKAGSRLVGVTVLDGRVKPLGMKRPALVLRDVEHYKGGNPQVETVTVAGPFNPTGVSDTPSRQRILVCRPKSSNDEDACATKILASLARRAYRRPVTAGDTQALLSLYRAGRTEGTFENGIETALRGVLAGPDFLFRIESDPANAQPGTPYRLSDLELATRLSFFLWSSIPDDELLGVAERGQLKDPAVLERQVRRMLADDRAHALVTNFAGQWLSLRDLEGIQPEWDEFPDFDIELRNAFREETERLVESMLREDRPVGDLLKADYTFANERLARHYGIPNVFGNRFRRVPLTGSSRRGLLGHGSILTVTSLANRTSPVLRGKWVLERLMDLSPPPPPADVPALEEKNAQGEQLTMRAALEQHRSNPVCASCHKIMDGVGFALENFDAVGRYRTIEAGAPVDASGVLYDGSEFENLGEFQDILLTHTDRFVHTLTKNLLTYATSRPLQHSDMPAIRRIMRDAKASEYRWSSLILGVIRSAPFQMRRSGTS